MICYNRRPKFKNVTAVFSFNKTLNNSSTTNSFNTRNYLYDVKPLKKVNGYLI